MILLIRKTKKACKGCNIIKPISEFYKKRNTPNRRAYCRECYLAMSRKWAELNPERKAAHRRAYKSTTACKLAQKRYRKNNPEKNKAAAAIGRAIKRGDVKRLPCRICGQFPTHGHHSDYSKPLSVTWLCPKHHVRLHVKERGSILL